MRERLETHEKFENDLMRDFDKRIQEEEMDQCAKGVR